MKIKLIKWSNLGHFVLNGSSHRQTKQKIYRSRRLNPTHLGTTSMIPYQATICPKCLKNHEMNHKYIGIQQMDLKYFEND